MPDTETEAEPQEGEYTRCPICGGRVWKKTDVCYDCGADFYDQDD